jgi:hypothetical protein
MNDTAVASEDSPSEVDPDPFAIGMGILGILFGGGAYLEARRQRQFVERNSREQFRKAWFDARRTLIHARRVIEEFATYVEEDEFGTQQFAFGRVRLTIDINRAQQLRRLHGNAHVTAEHLADNLDALGDHLGPEYQPKIDAIFDALRAINQFPADYRSLVVSARRCLALYEELLDEVRSRESFDEN